MTTHGVLYKARKCMNCKMRLKKYVEYRVRKYTLELCLHCAKEIQSILTIRPQLNHDTASPLPCSYGMHMNPIVTLLLCLRKWRRYIPRPVRWIIVRTAIMIWYDNVVSVTKCDKCMEEGLCYCISMWQWMICVRCITWV